MPIPRPLAIVIAEAASTATALGAVIMVSRHPDSRGNHAPILQTGAVMFGTGFATHLPLQMLGEGKCSLRDIRHMASTKAIGIAAALGSIYAGKQLFAETIAQAEDSWAKKLEQSRLIPCADEKQFRSICRLAAVEIPSTIIGALVNIHASRHRH